MANSKSPHGSIAEDLHNSVSFIQSIRAIRPLGPVRREGRVHYTFLVQADATSWTLEKRFSEFDRLSSKLLGNCSFPLPQKNGFRLRRTNNSRELTNKRFEELSVWLVSLLRAVRQECCLLDSLLGGRTAVRDEMVMARTNASLVRTFLSNSNSRMGEIGPGSTASSSSLSERSPPFVSGASGLFSSFSSVGGGIEDTLEMLGGSGDNASSSENDVTSFTNTASRNNGEIQVRNLEQRAAVAVRTIRDHSAGIRAWAANTATLADRLLHAAQLPSVEWRIGNNMPGDLVEPLLASLTEEVDTAVLRLISQAAQLHEEQATFTASQQQLGRMKSATKARSSNRTTTIMLQLQAEVDKSGAQVASLRHNFAVDVAAIENRINYTLVTSHQRLVVWQCQRMASFSNHMHASIQGDPTTQHGDVIDDSTDDGFDGDEACRGSSRSFGRSGPGGCPNQSHGKANERARILSRHDLATSGADGCSSDSAPLSLKSASALSSTATASTQPFTTRKLRSRSQNESEKQMSSAVDEGNTNVANPEFGLRRVSAIEKEAVARVLSKDIRLCTHRRSGEQEDANLTNSSFGSEDSFAFTDCIESTDTENIECARESLNNVEGDESSSNGGVVDLSRYDTERSIGVTQRSSSMRARAKRGLSGNPSELMSVSVTGPDRHTGSRPSREDCGTKVNINHNDGVGGSGIWLKPCSIPTGCGVIGVNSESEEADSGRDEDSSLLSFNITSPSSSALCNNTPLKVKPRAIWEVFEHVDKPSTNEMSPMAPFNVSEWKMPSILSPEEQFISELGLRYACYGRQGKRPTMEDAHDVVDKTGASDPYAYFAIYDGHNGAEVSTALKDVCHDIITRSSYFPEDVERAIRDGCVEIDNYLLMKDVQGGSTAVLVFVFGGRAIVANVGDSEAVMCESGKAVPLCPFLHRPTHRVETERIEDAGGYVRNGRVMGIGLGVSRAFGDFDHKLSGLNDENISGDLVCTTPSVTSRRVVSDSDFIVVGCDGLFDVMSHQLVVDHVKAALLSGADVDTACRRLVDSAVDQYGSSDNVSVILVCFDRAVR